MSQVKKVALERLRGLLQEADSASYDWRDEGKSTEWKRRVEGALRRLFGNDSHHLVAFQKVRYGLSVFTDRTPDSAFATAYMNGIRNAQAILRAAIQDAEDYEFPVSPTSPVDSLLSESVSTDSVRSASVAGLTKVFIVHGHDDSMKEAVARFVERLKLEAVILAEQASGGATIIEKFERYRKVPFAIVLLSPDDFGCKAPVPTDPAVKPELLRPRARQNAVLELGFFLGALGRKNVCAVVRGPIELPSDIHGVVYIQFEGNGWRFELVRELKQAGFDVNANEAF